MRLEKKYWYFIQISDQTVLSLMVFFEQFKKQTPKRAIVHQYCTSLVLSMVPLLSPTVTGPIVSNLFTQLKNNSFHMRHPINIHNRQSIAFVLQRSMATQVSAPVLRIVILPIQFYFIHSFFSPFIDWCYIMP